MRELIRLISSAGTGHFYTTDKNKRTTPDKLEKENVRPARSQARDLQRRQNQVIDFLPCEKKPVSHESGFFFAWNLVDQVFCSNTT